MRFVKERVANEGQILLNYKSDPETVIDHDRDLGPNEVINRYYIESSQ